MNQDRGNDPVDNEVTELEEHCAELQDAIDDFEHNIRRIRDKLERGGGGSHALTRELKSLESNRDLNRKELQEARRRIDILRGGGPGVTENQRPPWILPFIVFSQFAGTSLWFAGNAVLSELRREWGLPPESLGHMTSAVQFGFIAGTLAFAYTAFSDRFSARNLFFICSILGAVSNLSVTLFAQGLQSLLVLRFVTGFFLAGIYPIGMKIAAGWYREGLGRAIGYLVGALTVGTAVPHLLRSLGSDLPWETVITGVSVLAALGGLAMYLWVPDGPHSVKGTRFDPKALYVIFRSPNFRASAFAYFGHMWELYALWAFVPFVLLAYGRQHGAPDLDISLWSFFVIGAGFVGCAGGGIISLRAGSARVAFTQLAASGVCCAISPFMFEAPPAVFLGFLVFWGVVVVGDSPQFSTLNARFAPRELVGSALTMANCIGFSITIVSIQLLNYLSESVGAAYILLPLTAGPILGLLALRPLLTEK